MLQRVVAVEVEVAGLSDETLTTATTRIINKTEAGPTPLIANLDIVTIGPNTTQLALDACHLIAVVTIFNLIPVVITTLTDIDTTLVLQTATAITDLETPLDHTIEPGTEVARRHDLRPSLPPGGDIKAQAQTGTTHANRGC